MILRDRLRARADSRSAEQGFVLATALVLIVVLTIIGVGLYYRSVISQQVSTVSRDSAKAAYYAESAINMVTWLLYRDPDNVDPYSSWDHDFDLDGDGKNDRENLQDSPDTPGAQLGYFDNRPLANRGLVYPGSVNVSLASLVLPVDLTLGADTYSAGFLGFPVDSYGNLGAPVLDTEPTEGAVLWLTAAENNESQPDFDHDKYVLPGEDEYRLVAYAIGIVGGKRLRMFRAIVGEVAPGGPVGIGSVTNARD